MPRNKIIPTANDISVAEAVKRMDEGMKRMRDSRPANHGEIIERRREEQRRKEIQKQ